MSEEQQAVEPSNEPAGLLDDVSATEEAQDSQPTEAAVEHRSSDSIPDDEPLERPDWWPENFWKKEDNEPDLEAIAKSWTDMRKIVSQGKHKAPPEGKYDTSAFGDNADTLPMMPSFTKWAAENGISQAAFDSFAKDMNDLAQTMMPPAIDVQAELKALGPNGEAMKNSMVNWARSLVNKGVWSAEDFEEFKYMGGTAKGLRALAKVRSAYEGKIPVESAPMEGGESDEELRAMINDQYYKDPAYRAKVERKFQQRYGNN
jgi:hypothetical protein